VCFRLIQLPSKPSCLLRAAVNVVSVYIDRFLLVIVAANVFPLKQVLVVCKDRSCLHPMHESCQVKSGNSQYAMLQCGRRGML